MDEKIVVEAIEMAAWPPSAWLAELDIKTQRLHLYHGSRVEVDSRGFCEAVWNGKYQEFNFDQTDLIFGSGCRIRESGITFVSSGSTVDRLQLFRHAKGASISNSLACLAQYHQLSVDVTKADYYEDFRTIVNGLSQVKTRLNTDKGPVELIYFKNLYWDGSELVIIEKPNGDRDFQTFEQFEQFLTQTVVALGDNMRSMERRAPFAPLATLSTGYDSSVVSVLCKKIDCKQVISFKKARGGLSDFGDQIAAQLGYEVIGVDRDQWRESKMPEIPFFSVNGYGEEVHYTALGKDLEGKVMFTGFHGDKVWDKEISDDSKNLVRGDPTGLSLTEYRLWCGMIHCPVPFIAARNIKSIVKLSQDASMVQWDVPGTYSRPLCRRIVESAGVARHLFGIEKKAASVVMRWRQDSFLTPASLSDFDNWLQEHQKCWLKKGKVPPRWYPDFMRFSAFSAVIHGVLRFCDNNQGIPGLWRLSSLLGHFKVHHKSKYLFPWALKRTGEKYQDPEFTFEPE